MWKLLSKTKERFVSFCERCGSVCDATCRADAILQHARERALAYGWRQS